MSDEMKSWTPEAEPQRVAFGPCRVIGMRYVGKNERGEIPALWEKEFLPRMGEIERPEHRAYCFGLCRCLPNAQDGSFEYVAAAAATADAPIPAGMLEIMVPAADYLALPVRNLEEIFQAWPYMQTWVSGQSKWKAKCGPERCDCAHFPCFELYPTDFSETGRLSLYVPVQSGS